MVKKTLAFITINVLLASCTPLNHEGNLKNPIPKKDIQKPCTYDFVNTPCP